MKLTVWDGISYQGGSSLCLWVADFFTWYITVLILDAMESLGPDKGAMHVVEHQDDLFFWKKNIYKSWSK